MKKGKIISMPVTPEAQIRSRARSLPIGKCYVNADWKKSQMASVIVTREHVSGNITYGFYLVDLNLLGVKDCFCAFNELPAEMEERIHEHIDEFVECDYALAHNIIYEGVAFAERYGFEPAKEFIKTGMYILEENTDNVPAMDIPLGKDGVPVVFTAPDRNMQHEIAILEKTAGTGNFIIYMDEKTNVFEMFGDDDDEYDEDEYDEDEEGDEYDDDDDDDDDEYDDDDDDIFDDDYSYEEALNEIQEMGIEDFVAEYSECGMSPVQMLAMADVSYYAIFGPPDADIMDGILDLILNDKRFDREETSPFGLEKYNDSIQSVVNKLMDDDETALQDMEELVAEHIDDLELGIFHINLLRDLNQRSELERLTLYWYDRAPDHYVMRLLYTEWLIEQERYAEVFQLFGNRSGLDALTTDDVLFTDTMVSSFCACYLLAWLSKDKMELAEPYYQIIMALECMTPFVKNAVLAMMAKKTDALVEKSMSEKNSKG